MTQQKSDRNKFKIGRRGAVIAAASIVLGGLLGYFLLSSRMGEERRIVGKVIPLPESKKTGAMSVEEALERRRSIRDYTGEPITLEQVSQLLWAAQGITLPEWGFRTAPSAGGTYPLEVYIVVKEGGVVDLEEGVYHYIPRSNILVQILKGDFSKELMVAAVDQPWVEQASINIVMTAIFERTTERYGERGIHYVWQETGHAGQNIYLQAAAMNLGTVVIGAYHDEEVQRILGVPFDEKPVYIIPVGVPKKT